MTRFAQMDRFLFPDNLDIFEMKLCATPFAFDIAEQVPESHAAATKEAVVHVCRVVLHEIAALWTDSVERSIELEHISNKIDPLQFVLCTKACLFFLALGFCVLSELFQTTVVNTVPIIREQIPLLLNLVNAFSAVERSRIIIDNHAGLTVRVDVMDFFRCLVSHKALELLTLHADKGLSNGVVHLFAVFDIVHVPQSSDLANGNMKRKSEHPDVDFTIVGSGESSYRFKLVSWKRFDEGSHVTLHTGTVVGLAELLQFRNTVFAHTKNLKPLNRKWFQRNTD